MRTRVIDRMTVEVVGDFRANKQGWAGRDSGMVIGIHDLAALTLT